MRFGLLVFAATVSLTAETLEVAVHRIAQEAVNNALKHGKANKIRIALTRTSRGIELAVSDNGIGHIVEAQDAENQSRLHSIRHRCRAIDATLSIGKGRVGGTIVRIVWRGIEARKSPLRIPTD